MRSLILSTGLIICLGISWIFYDIYSEKTIDNISYTINDEMLPALRVDDWEKAETRYLNVLESWKDYRAVSEYFLDTKSLDEIEENLFKTRCYLMFRDKSEASAASKALVLALTRLDKNEAVTPGNVL